MDELAAAQMFLQVVGSRSFSLAARALGKSASTLSRAVIELEEHFGAQLLARTTRRLHLTEAGSLYVDYAQRLLATSGAAHDAIAELTGGVPRGRLRVSMPVSVGERLLAAHLPAFRRQYPELRLDLELSDRNVALVQGGFDLVIRAGRPQDSSLRAQLLGRIPIILVASPAYLEARGVPRQPEAILDHDAITLGLEGGPVDWTFHRGGKREVVSVDGVAHTTSPTLATQLAVAGMGLLRVTQWSVREELLRGELVETMTVWSCNNPQYRGVPIYVIYAQAGSTTPPSKSRIFVHLIKNVLAAEEAKNASVKRDQRRQPVERARVSKRQLGHLGRPR